VEKRLAAAAKAQRRGYRLGFHFDPIIPLPGWEEDYARVIEQIFRAVDPSSVAWISLGVLRFVPALKETAGSRFGAIPHFHDGFRPGLDGKSRLFADRRVEVYRRMAENIRLHSPNARIYLCMESPEVWTKSLSITFTSAEQLSAYLDEAVTRGKTHSEDV
jgi:spore photoproduct lyase